MNFFTNAVKPPARKACANGKSYVVQSLRAGEDGPEARGHGSCFRDAIAGISRVCTHLPSITSSQLVAVYLYEYKSLSD